MKPTLATAVVTILATTVIAVAQQQSGLAQEEQACEGDAFQFCSSYIPDHQKIRDCLYEYRSKISPACRALIDPSNR